MGYEIDQIWFRLKGAVDASLETAAREGQAVFRRTAEEAERSATRVEKAIGQGTATALRDMAAAAPAAEQAGRQVGSSAASGVASGFRAGTTLAGGKLKPEEITLLRGLSDTAKKAGGDAGLALLNGMREQFKVRVANYDSFLADGLITKDARDRSVKKIAADYYASLRDAFKNGSAGGQDFSNKALVAFSREAQLAAKAAGVQLGEAAGEGTSTGFTSKLRGLRSAFFIAAAAVGVEKYFESLFKEADDAASAERRLRAAARQAGGGEAGRAPNVGHAQEQLRLARVPSEQLVASLGALTRKAGELDRLDDAAAAFMDLGISRGMNIEEALKAAGDAARGSSGAIEQLLGKSKEQLEAEYRLRHNVIGALNEQQQAQALLEDAMRQGGRAAGALAAYLQTEAGASELATQRMKENAAAAGENNSALRDLGRTIKTTTLESLNALVSVLGSIAEFARHPIRITIDTYRRNYGDPFPQGGRQLDYSPTIGPDGKPLPNATAADSAMSVWINRPIPRAGVATGPDPVQALQARVTAMRQALENNRAAEESAVALARADNAERGSLVAEAAAQRESNRYRQERNRLVREYLAELRRGGAGTATQAEIAKFSDPATQGVEHQRSLAESADAATEQLRIQAQQIQLLQKYWGDAATAPEALKHQVEEVTRLERESAQAAQQRLKLAHAGRDTRPADTVIAELDRQSKIAQAVLDALAPAEAAFQRAQSSLTERRPGMTEEQAAEAGRENATAYDRALLAAIAANPDIGPALRAHLKGGFDAKSVAATLISPFVDEMNQRLAEIDIQHTLGELTESQAEAAGHAAAVKMADALAETIRSQEVAGTLTPALREAFAAQLHGLKVDPREIGLDKILVHLGGTDTNALAALDGIQTAVDGVARAQHELELATSQYGEHSAEAVAANEALAASHKAVRDQVALVEQALRDAGLTDQQAALVAQQLAGYLRAGGVEARDFADSISSVAGKLTAVQGIAQAFLTIAGSAASQEVRETLEGIDGLAGSLKQLQAARQQQSKDQKSGTAGVGDMLGVLGGYAAVAGQIVNLGSAILGAGERHRIAMIQQTTAVLRNTDALNAFEHGQIADVSATERDQLLKQGAAFISAHLLEGRSEDDHGKINVRASELDFLQKLQKITGVSFLDEKGKIDPGEFTRAWEAFQKATLGVFGTDVQGRIKTFEFLVSSMGDALGGAGAQVKLLVEQLRKVDALNGTTFADQLQKVFDEQGADAAKAWLQNLVQIFAASGPDAAELKALFGSALTADEIQQILQEALGTVGEGGGAVGGGDNAQRLTVNITEAQANAMLLQMATQTSYQEYLPRIYEAITGAALGSLRAQPIPVPTVEQVAAISGGGGSATTVYEVYFQGDNYFELPAVANSPRSNAEPRTDPVSVARAAGEAFGDSASERIRAAIRGQGGSGPARITVRSGGLQR